MVTKESINVNYAGTTMWPPDDKVDSIDDDAAITMTSTIWSNTTDVFQYDPDNAWRASVYKVSVPILLMFSVVALIANLFIVISVRWIRRSLSPTLCFNVSLAVADAYAAVIFGTGLLVNSLLPVSYGISMKSMCFIMALESFRFAGLIISVLHLLMLAVNHYIGIIRPLHYASTMTRRNAMISITAMWLKPLAFFLVYFSSEADQGFRSEGCENYHFMVKFKYRFITSTLFFVPLVFMFVIYVHIFFIVLKHNRGLQEHFNHHHGTEGSSRHFRHNVKAATTTLVILGTYTVGWMPAVLFYVLVCEDCVINLKTMSPVVLLSVTIITNSLIACKLVVNPIIYAARMKDFRVAIRRMAAFCLPVFCTSPSGGRTSSGMMDEANSSFIRSRSDTMHTSIRMQSVAYGTKGVKGRRDLSPPVLVYQKINNGVTSTNKGSPTNTMKTYVTSSNNVTTCLLD